MADELLPVGQLSNKKRLADMGDGSHAEVVKLGAGSASIGTVDTELPAAVAAADNLANPTAPSVLAHLLGWTGSVWRRLALAAGGALRVTVETPSGTAWSFTTPGDSDANALLPAVNARPQLFGGAMWERQRTPTVFKVVDLAAGTSETTIWTPAASKKFRLMGFLLTCEAASTLTFKDNTGGSTIYVARGGVDVPITPAGMGNGILSGTANNVLTVTRGTSTALRGVVWGTEE